MKNVLVTGFPGFLATFLVRELARVAGRVHLLVEERFLDKARSGAAELAAELGRPAKMFSVVTGDIRADGLGLGRAASEEILSETDTVFHLAAIYDLAMTRDIGLAVNVEGTRRVNDFVRRMKALACYAYVSTAFVAGKQTGTIREADFREGVSFRNYYEETKHLAEKPVRMMASEVPVVIFRPTVVVGHSQTGYTIKYDGPYMIMKAIQRLPGFLGRVNFGTPYPFNVVPVDFVTAAMARLAADPRAIGKTFHLGDPDPMTSRQIARLFCQLLRGKGTWATLPVWMVRLSSATPLVPWVFDIPGQAVPYFYSNLSFDTSNTQELLRGSDVRFPRITEYAPNIVRYFVEHPVPGT